MRKPIIGIWLFGMAVLAISIFFIVNWINVGTQRYSSEDYRDGQDQFIALVGEDAFADFEHNHPPLNCSETEWEEKPLLCSESWLHRFEIADITGSTIQPESTQTSSLLSK